MRVKKKEFIDNTGYNFADVAREFNISRQFIDKTLDNISTTYVNSAKFMMICMIDKKINELKEKISSLEDYKNKIKSYENFI